MSVCRVFILVATLAGVQPGSIPTNTVGINNIIDIPNKVSNVGGFGKGNSSQGTTTVMGSNFGLIPNPSQMFGNNKTENNTNGFGNIGAMITDIPNKVFGLQNNTGSGGIGPMIPGLPGAILGYNKTGSGTNSSTWFPDFGSVVSEIPHKIFGNKNMSSGYESGSENRNATTTGRPMIPGVPNNIFAHKPSGSGCNNNYGSHLTAAIPGYGTITPEKVLGANTSDVSSAKSQFTEGVVEEKSRKRRCRYCNHHGDHGDDGLNGDHGHHGHNKTLNVTVAQANVTRTKRQTFPGSLGSAASNFSSLASTLGAGGNGLGSVASGLTSAAADATLVMGMFQILVKPMKSLADGFTDIMKNPQSILTQPQTLLNGVSEASDEVEVCGALALVLRVSRAAGVAPLRLVVVRAGYWRATVSPPVAAFCRAVMMLFNLIVLTGLVLDFQEEPSRRVRGGESTLKAVIWIGDMALVMLIGNIAVLAGPSRMLGLIKVLKQLKKIKNELKMEDPSARIERFKCIAIVCILVWSTLTQLWDIVDYMLTTVKEGKRWSIMCMYLTYYYVNMMGLMVMLQWCSAALGAYGAAAALNRQLDEFNQACMETESSDLYISSPPGVGTMVDCFTIRGTGKHSGADSYSHAQAAIRRLALSYERISEVIRQLNAGNGAILLAMLTSICFRLVLTPYYMLLGLFNNEDVVAPVVIIQTCWSLFHINNLLLIVEPCHWTHEQRERTQILLGQLMAHLAPRCEDAGRDLAHFAKQAQLSHAHFMPLGIYTLARPLMVTILGGVTTYLVIIIQFQKISNLL